MLHRLLAATLASPRRTLVFWAVAVVLAVLGALRLDVDLSSSAFYARDTPQLAALRNFSARWGPDDRTLVLVAQRGGQDMSAAHERPTLAALAAELEQTEAVVSVRGLHQLPSLPLLALQQTDAVPLLLSEDATTTALLLELRTSSDDPRFAIAAMTEVEQVLDRQRRATGLQLDAAGIPATRAAFITLAIGDQMVLGPLAASLAGLLLLIAWRRPRLVAVAGVAAGVPLLLLLGVMGWTGEPIGLLNQAYFTLLPAIALADAVHLVIRARDLRRRDATRPITEVVHHAATRIGWACLLTSLTTGLGFASLATTSLPMLQHFGLYAAAGIGLAYATVVTLVPVLLLWANPDAAPRRRWPVLGTVARICARRPRATIAAAVVLSAAAYVPARAVVVDNHLSHLLEPAHPVRVASAVVDQKLGGTLSIELEIRAPEALSERVLADGVTAVRSAVDAPAVRAVLGPSTTRPGAPFLSSDRRTARISVRTQDIGGKAFAQLQRKAHDAATHAFVSADVVATGSASVAYDGVNRITAELRRSLIGLLALVTVLIALLLRSAGMAARSVLPNLLPLWLGYALIGIVGIELDPIAAVVLALALGIAVDDTIHVLARFTELRAAGSERVDAAVEAVETSGEAVALTSICLAVALAVNMGSSFPPLVVLGWLGAAVMLVALVADITVLPALLALGEAGPTPTRGPAPRMGSEPQAESPDSPPTRPPPSTPRQPPTEH